MSNTATYWLSFPRSASAPIGPLTVADLASRLQAGTVPTGAKVCEIGKAEWVSVSAVVPPAPSAASTPSPVNRLPNSSPIRYSSRVEIKNYSNLAEVGRALQLYGRGQKIIAYFLGAGGAMAFLASFADRSGDFARVGSILIVGVAVGMHVGGMLIAAAGEAMHAVRDIAVNTAETAVNTSGRGAGHG